MKRVTKKSKRSQQSEGAMGKVRAKPEVLQRFTPQQLAELEQRVSRDVSDAELRQLIAAADAAYIRVQRIDQLLRDLKALRVRRGLSQAQVDERSGIGRANISRLENLRLENPTLDTVMRYAQAIGVELCIAVRDTADQAKGEAA